MNLQALDDRALVERLVARRDERAFAELYRRHSPALFATAMRLSTNAADAEDAVHDAWVRAVERLALFEWRGSLRSWLTGFVVNVVHEIRRVRGREAPGDVSEMVGDSPELDELLSIDIEVAINRLAPRYREVFVLHDIDGFAHHEIALMLSIDIGTSKSQLSRARGHLRRMLGQRVSTES